MDEYLGRQHEEEVLQAFERVQDEFRALTEETEGDPLPPETDVSAGDSAAVYAAGEPLTGRSARHAGSRSKKPAKPQKETKAETKKPVEKKPEKPKKKNLRHVQIVKKHTYNKEIIEKLEKNEKVLNEEIKRAIKLYTGSRKKDMFIGGSDVEG